MEFYITGVILSSLSFITIIIYGLLQLRKHRIWLNNANVYLAPFQMIIATPTDEDDSYKLNLIVLGKKFITNVPSKYFNSGFKLDEVFISFLLMSLLSWVGVVYAVYYLLKMFFHSDKELINSINAIPNIQDDNFLKLIDLLPNEHDDFLKLINLVKAKPKIKRRFIESKKINNEVTVKNKEFSEFYKKTIHASDNFYYSRQRYQYYFSENKLFHKLFDFYRGYYPEEQPVLENHFASDADKVKNSDLESKLSWHECTDLEIKYFLMYNRYDVFTSEDLELFLQNEVKRLSQGYGQILNEIKELKCIYIEEEEYKYWDLPKNATEENILKFKKLRSNQLIENVCISYSEFEHYEEIIKTITDYLVLLKE